MALCETLFGREVQFPTYELCLVSPAVVMTLGNKTSQGRRLRMPAMLILVDVSEFHWKDNLSYHKLQNIIQPSNPRI
jgi:hypothetical protein